MNVTTYYRTGLLLVAGLVAGGAVGWLVKPAPPASAPPAEQHGAAAPGGIALPTEARKNNPIETMAVALTKLARDVEVVGSVGFDQDHVAQVGPLIAGRVVSLKARIGDVVRSGQVLAEIESAEVGQAQGAYLSARATSRAAQANLHREVELLRDRATSERNKEVAQAQAITEQANLSAALQRLLAIGLRKEDLQALEEGKMAPGRVPLLAPLDGTVIKREVTLGEAVQPAKDAFSIANLDHLWVQLDLFEKDLAAVHVGQSAELRTEVVPGHVFKAHVAYVGHVIDERTRTAPVRIQFDNDKGLMRPGQFVTATLRGDKERVATEVLAVPRRAVLLVEGRPVAFVAAPDGTFQRRAVELGVSGGGLVEIRSGLSAGERVATDGAFILKSELLR